MIFHRFINFILFVLPTTQPHHKMNELDDLLTFGHLAAEKEREELQNKMINEEYKIWKKNSVFLYDIMYRFVLARLSQLTLSANSS